MNRYTIADIEKLLIECSHEVTTPMNNGPDIIQYKFTCDPATLHIMLSDVKKELEGTHIENRNLKAVLAEFNFRLKLFLGTYIERFDEDGMPKNLGKRPTSLLDLVGILKDGPEKEES